MKSAPLFCAAFLLSALLPAAGCLWDSDTLAVEKARLPGVHSILTGNFPRHSRAFFEWRVKQSQELLAKNRRHAAAWDDLAVARHKLGDHKAAIGTMQAKEALLPGLYETYSNLGTFYIYTGDLKEAVVWIDRALKINPNAHFGREKYQKWLVEWVLDGKPGPERKKAIISPAGFAYYVLEKQKSARAEGGRDEKWQDERLQEARTGVLGMMRFADFDNPLLQEALGDILCSGSFRGNAGHLGYQSYLQALTKLPPEDGAAVQRVKGKMDIAAKRHSTFNPKDTAADLATALEQGRTLTARVEEDEAKWIAAGKNVSAEFTAKYLPPPKPAGGRR